MFNALSAVNRIDRSSRKTIVAILFLGAPLAGIAQLAYNTNILPLGDKEAMMANTGTGGVGSLAAVYYNPAALSELQGTSFSLAGSAFMGFSFSASPLAYIDGTRLDFEGKGFQGVPTSFIIARSTGVWKLAFSILVPTEFHYEGQQQWSFPVQGVPVRLKQLENYSEVLYLSGLTAARKLNDEWSLGFSLAAHYYNTLSTSEARLAVVDDPSLLSINTSRDRRTAFGLFGIIGLLHKGALMDVGLRVITPGARLGGTGEYYEYSFNNLGGPGTEQSGETDLTALRADFRDPMDIRLGLTYRAAKALDLSFDASYATGVEYDAVSGSGLRSVQQVDASYRLSLGAEGKVNDDLSILAGGSYSPTKSSTDHVASSVDFTGYSIGVKKRKGVVESTIGFFHSGGIGDYPVDGLSTRGEQRYTFNGLFLRTTIKM